MDGFGKVYWRRSAGGRIPIGTDQNARRFLKLLDDELLPAGAKFDIVDTVNLDEVEEMGLTEVLLGAIHD